MKNKVFKLIFTETEITCFYFLKMKPRIHLIKDITKITQRTPVKMFGEAIAGGANIFEFSDGLKAVVYTIRATPEQRNNYFDYLRRTGLVRS